MSRGAVSKAGGWRSALRGLRARASMALQAALLLALTADPATALTLVDDRGQTVNLAQPAQRIVSLSPSNTESVCALGACERLVGVDRYSSWPESVRTLPRLGGLEDTPIERVVALRPDLVLAPSSSRAIARLEGLGLKVLALEPKGFADTRRVLNTVAQAIGQPEAGEAVWGRMLARIEAAGHRLPAAWSGASAYVEVAETPFAASAGSFVGELLARMGLVSIVPAQLGPFPQISPEFVVRANPTLIVASEQGMRSMAKRPGWGALDALRTGRRCGLPTERWDPLMRAGPRLGEAADALADCLMALPPPR